VSKAIKTMPQVNQDNFVAQQMPLSMLQSIVK